MVLVRRRALIRLAGAATLSGCARQTPPFVDKDGRPLSNSIAEEGLVSLSDGRAYVLVRGRNDAHPAILFLHGGPGASETALMRLFQQGLEDRFVMAYWDQRGAGRSYRDDMSASFMTVDQLLDDMDHVVDYLRSRLEKRRIWLLGHSWGSALGILYSQRHAQKISGYIGTGQVASYPQMELHAYEFAVMEANRRGDENVRESLKIIGPPPHTYDQLVVRDRLLDMFGGYNHLPLDKWRVVVNALLKIPEADVRDLFRLWRGTVFSQRALWPQIARLDLPLQVPELDVPVAFILGRYDQRTWSPYAAAYLADIRAPSKRLVWLENSAHNGPFEEPDIFRDIVVSTVSMFTS